MAIDVKVDQPQDQGIQINVCFHAMGGPCVIQLYGDDESILQTASTAAINEVARLEQKYSRYLDESVVSKINKHSGSHVKNLDQETIGLMNYAKACFELSDGLFDITTGVLRKIWDFKNKNYPDKALINNMLSFVGFEQLNWNGHGFYLPHGMEIDFGGIVKEYAADQLKTVLASFGVSSGYVDLAGDIVVLGPKKNEPSILVGIKNPANTSEAIRSVQLHKGAIATSGNYERYIMVDGKRYCHILNPQTGYPVQYCATVSVIGDHCLVSGSLATIAMLKERQGVTWLQQQGARFFAQDYLGKNFESLA